MSPLVAPKLPRVLCVDDEPAVLDGLARVLFDEYDIAGETSPVRALERLVGGETFDVLISDMRMPEMSGAEMLAEAARRVPDTMRILLTGYADVDAALAAVNEGRIFRFLRKPCNVEELSAVVGEAVRERRRTLAERELLESTLKGAVCALGDMLALLAPEVFRHSSALARAAAHVAARLHVEPRWAVEVAARLSQVGCVALPADLLDRDRYGKDVAPGERTSLEAHPETGFRLLSNIPRLEGVATMVRHQRQDHVPPTVQPQWVKGVRILQVLVRLDQKVHRGEAFHTARLAMRRGASGDAAKILDALADFTPKTEGAERRSVTIAHLRVGAVLAGDVISNTGVVVVSKGTEVTAIVRERLINFAHGVGVREPLVIWDEK